MEYKSEANFRRCHTINLITNFLSSRIDGDALQATLYFHCFWFWSPLAVAETCSANLSLSYLQRAFYSTLVNSSVKIPHHGSDRTASAGFYRNCKAYVYIVSGSHCNPHGNPKLSSIEAIVGTFYQRTVRFAPTISAPLELRLQTFANVHRHLINSLSASSLATQKPTKIGSQLLPHQGQRWKPFSPMLR